MEENNLHRLERLAEKVVNETATPKEVEEYKLLLDEWNSLVERIQHARNNI
ncbi:hypothetical protein [Colwellia sp. 75C3]|uniref:hypothetical protein n=1 Tax=Colwellia sp. 75C3 TaxID=888425 RepID=UPI0012FE8F22|nr:hypothetical protein [Colwellia sp. 75C3]